MTVRELQTLLAGQGFQIDIDDSFGPQTASALATAIVERRDIGDLAAIRQTVAASAPTPDRVEAFYGPSRSICYDDPATRGAVLLKPESTWRKLNISRYVLATGHPVLLHKRAAGAFIAAFAELRVACFDHPGEWTPGDVQSFCLRHMLWNPDKPLSFHSSGCAIDIDPGQNAFGKTGALDAVPWAVKTLEAWGICWGGRWKPKASRDPMHFEFARR